VSTFETPEVFGAIIRRIDELLKKAMAEAGAVLQGSGASPEETWKATVPFIPLIRLLRDSLAVRKDAAPPAVPSAPDRLEGRSLPPSPKEIEERFLTRGSAPGNVFPLRRR
jgi:hypothetical protein